MSRLLVAVISFYQRFISPGLGFRCRYVPSCSEYMKEAIQARGAVRGLVSGLGRLLRCAPWGGSGFDPYEKQS